MRKIIIPMLIILIITFLLSNKSHAQSWNLLLWNKLGSAAEVTHSEIGPDGIIVGDISYWPGQFDNGFRPEPRTGDPNLQTNCIKYDGLNLGQKGCIEFWFQPDWVSGSPIRHILNYTRPDGQHLLQVHYNDWQNRLSITISNSTYSEIVLRTIVPSSTPEWSTTEPFHIAIVWDGTASNNADKLKLFLNGNERGTLYSAGSPTLADWGSGNYFWLATAWREGDWYRHPWEGTDGVMDNIKIWDYPKTDFSDRFYESGDTDDDGIEDDYDNCPDTDLGEIVDETGCSIADICPCDNQWKNHGDYVRCVAHTSEDFVAAGLITDAEKDIIVSNAAESNCGHKK